MPTACYERKSSRLRRNDTGQERNKRHNTHIMGEEGPMQQSCWTALLLKFRRTSGLEDGEDPSVGPANDSPEIAGKYPEQKWQAHFISFLPSSSLPFSNCRLLAALASLYSYLVSIIFARESEQVGKCSILQKFVVCEACKRNPQCLVVQRDNRTFPYEPRQLS